MQLPTEKKPAGKVGKHTVLLYGPPKIGKSTFGAGGEDTLVIATERGLGAIECYPHYIKTWMDFIDTVKALSTDKKFKNVSIDLISEVYEMCRTHKLKELGIEYEDELSSGKGWAVVRTEFKRVISALLRLDLNVIMIAHEKTKEVKAKTGKYNKAVADMHEKVATWLGGKCDFILYCDVERSDSGGYDRVLRTKNAKGYDAGGRYNVLPDTIQLDHKTFIKEVSK